MSEDIRQRLYALDDRHEEYLWKQEHNRKVDEILAEIEAAGKVIVDRDGPPLTPDGLSDLKMRMDAVVQQYGCRPGMSIFHPLISEVGLAGFRLVPIARYERLKGAARLWFERKRWVAGDWVQGEEAVYLDAGIEPGDLD